MSHVRSDVDSLFGRHDEAEDPTCAGSRCPACDCCLHCTEEGCDCSAELCGCSDL